MYDIGPALQQASKHSQPVLLLGETGTGKSYLAKCIHDNSERAGRPYYGLNIARLRPGTAESELFGHERGAFTGAIGTKRGIFELYTGGTVLLDEIGKIDLTLQAMLHTFLDKYRFTRVGAEEETEANVRIISATNENLEKKIEAGTFYVDLYYRLAKQVIAIPPLRERREDIPLLIIVLLNKICTNKEYTFPDISRSALYKLCTHKWQGNIRELEGALEMALVRADGNSILDDHIELDSKGVNIQIAKAKRPSKTLTDKELDDIIVRIDENDEKIAPIARGYPMDRSHLSRQIAARRKKLGQSQPHTHRSGT